MNALQLIWVSNQRSRAPVDPCRTRTLWLSKTATAKGLTIFGCFEPINRHLERLLPRRVLKSAAVGGQEQKR